MALAFDIDPRKLFNMDPSSQEMGTELTPKAPEALKTPEVPKRLGVIKGTPQDEVIEYPPATNIYGEEYSPEVIKGDPKDQILPAPAPPSTAEKVMGGVNRAISGAAMGAMGGPAGMAVGATLGVAAPAYQEWQQKQIEEMNKNPQWWHPYVKQAMDIAGLPFGVAAFPSGLAESMGKPGTIPEKIGRGVASVGGGLATALGIAPEHLPGKFSEWHQPANWEDYPIGSAMNIAAPFLMGYGAYKGHPPWRPTPTMEPFKTPLGIEEVKPEGEPPLLPGGPSGPEYVPPEYPTETLGKERLLTELPEPATGLGQPGQEAEQGVGRVSPLLTEHPVQLALQEIFPSGDAAEARIAEIGDSHRVNYHSEYVPGVGYQLRLGRVGDVLGPEYEAHLEMTGAPIEPSHAETMAQERADIEMRRLGAAQREADLHEKFMQDMSEKAITATGGISDWLRESMEQQGLKPERMLNEVEMGREGVRENILKDPVVQFLKDRNPKLYGEALKGNITKEEYLQAKHEFTEFNNQKASNTEHPLTPTERVNLANRAPEASEVLDDMLQKQKAMIEEETQRYGEHRRIGIGILADALDALKEGGKAARDAKTWFDEKGTDVFAFETIADVLGLPEEARQALREGKGDPQAIRDTIRLYSGYGWIPESVKTLQDMVRYFARVMRGQGGMFAGKNAFGFAEAEKLGQVFLGKRDQLPRFWIDDKPLAWKIDWANAPVSNFMSPKAAKLDLLVDHPKLFENYEHLGIRDIRVMREQMGWGNWGAIDTKNNVLKINALLSPQKALWTLTHEIQHWIQEKEGFARGSGADLIDVFHGIAKLKEVIENAFQPGPKQEAYRQEVANFEANEPTLRSDLKWLQSQGDNIVKRIDYFEALVEQMKPVYKQVVKDYAKSWLPGSGIDPVEARQLYQETKARYKAIIDEANRSPNSETGQMESEFVAAKTAYQQEANKYRGLRKLAYDLSAGEEESRFSAATLASPAESRQFMADYTKVKALSDEYNKALTEAKAQGFKPGDPQFDQTVKPLYVDLWSGIEDLLMLKGKALNFIHRLGLLNQAMLDVESLTPKELATKYQTRMFKFGKLPDEHALVLLREQDGNLFAAPPKAPKTFSEVLGRQQPFSPTLYGGLGWLPQALDETGKWVSRTINFIGGQKGLPNRFTGQEFLNLMKKWYDKGDIKREEWDDWNRLTGLKQWVKDQGDKKIAKDDLIDYLQLHGIRVYEVLRSQEGERKVVNDRQDAWNTYQRLAGDEAVPQSEVQKAKDEYERIAEVWNSMKTMKYESSIQLPGADNQIELTLWSPQAGLMDPNESHFVEGEALRQIGWIRGGEYTADDGRRFFHVQEIQSHRYQTARNLRKIEVDRLIRGEKTDNLTPEAIAKKEELKNQIEATRAKIDLISSQMENFDTVAKRLLDPVEAQKLYDEFEDRLDSYDRVDLRRIIERQTLDEFRTAPMYMDTPESLKELKEDAGGYLLGALQEGLNRKHPEYAVRQDLIDKLYGLETKLNDIGLNDSDYIRLNAMTKAEAEAAVPKDYGIQKPLPPDIQVQVDALEKEREQIVKDIADLEKQRTEEMLQKSLEHYQKQLENGLIAEEEYNESIERIKSDPYNGSPDDVYYEVSNKYFAVEEGLRSKSDGLRRQINDLKRPYVQRGAMTDMPYMKSWPTLLLKWVLKYAAERGLDGVTFSTGDQAYTYESGKLTGHQGWYGKVDPEYVSSPEVQPLINQLKQNAETTADVIDRYNNGTLAAGNARFQLDNLGDERKALERQLYNHIKVGGEHKWARAIASSSMSDAAKGLGTNIKEQMLQLKGDRPNNYQWSYQPTYILDEKSRTTIAQNPLTLYGGYGWVPDALKMVREGLKKVGETDFGESLKRIRGRYLDLFKVPDPRSEVYRNSVNRMIQHESDNDLNAYVVQQIEKGLMEKYPELSPDRADAIAHWVERNEGTLSPAEQEMAKAWQDTTKTLGEEAKKEGVLDRAMVAYYTHILLSGPDIENVKEAKSYELRRAWFTKPRSEEMYSVRELQEKGYKVLTDPRQVIPLYQYYMTREILKARLAKDLLSMRTTEGYPIIVDDRWLSTVPQEISGKYVAPTQEVSDFIMHQFRRITKNLGMDEVADTRLGRSPVLRIHTDANTNIGAVLGSVYRSEDTLKLRAVMSDIRRLNLFIPTIHGNNVLSSFLQIAANDLFRDKWLMTSEEKAYWKERYIKGGGKPSDLFDIQRLLTRGEYEPVQHRMDVDKLWRMFKSDPSAPIRKLLDKPFTALGEGAKLLRDFADYMLWDKIVEPLQIHGFRMAVEQLARRAPKDLPVEALDRAAAVYANDMFGTMQRSTASLQQQRLTGSFLLAPRWTPSIIREMVGALGAIGSEGKSAGVQRLGVIPKIFRIEGVDPRLEQTMGKMYLKSLAAGAIGLIAWVNAIQYIRSQMAGQPFQPTWENPEGHKFDANLYKKNLEGEEEYLKSGFFRQTEDMVKLLTGSWWQLSLNKAHPVWREIMSQAMNYDRWSKSEIAPDYGSNAPWYNEYKLRGKHAAVNLTPIGQITGLRPEQYRDWTETLLPFLGNWVTHGLGESPITSQMLLDYTRARTYNKDMTKIEKLDLGNALRTLDPEAQSAYISEKIKKGEITPNQVASVIGKNVAPTLFKVMTTNGRLNPEFIHFLIQLPPEKRQKYLEAFKTLGKPQQ